MNRMRRFSAFCAALLVAPGVASAAEPPCLTPAEFTSLASYALPSIISGTSQRCSASLGPNAWLPRNSDKLASNYARNKPSAWPGAKAAFLKLSSNSSDQANRLFRDMPDASLQQILDAMMEGMVSQSIPLERCGTIDGVIRLLAPLPPENTAELIALAVGLGSKTKEPKVGKLNICKT
jgi:hypothetical protein